MLIALVAAGERMTVIKRLGGIADVASVWAAPVQQLSAAVPRRVEVGTRQVAWLTAEKEVHISNRHQQPDDSQRDSPAMAHRSKYTWVLRSSPDSMCRSHIRHCVRELTG